MKHGTNSRVAIHLACTAKLGTRNLPLFKIPLEPTRLTAHTTHTRIPFSIMVPGDVPSSVDHPVRNTLDPSFVLYKYSCR